MKRKIQIACSILAFITVAFFIGFGIGRLLMDHSEAKPVDVAKIGIAIVCCAVSLFVGFFLNTVLHEAGHLVGGLLTGYRFLMFRVFSYTLTKDSDGYKWKRFGISGTMGQCIMMPPVGCQPDKVPYFWYNAGGVIVNLIIIIASGLPLLLLELSTFWYSLCVMLAATGAYVFLLNAIPVCIGGIPNDGKNILDMWRHPEQRVSFVRMMDVAAEQAFGKRLMQMPSEWFVDEPLTQEPSVMQISDRILYESWLIDHMQLDEARKVTEEIMSIGDKLPGLYKQEVACDRLILELATLNRADVIEQLWTKPLQRYVRQMANYSPMKQATLFAYELIANQNPGEAQKHYDEVIARKDRYTSPGEALTAIAVMDCLRTK